MMKRNKAILCALAGIGFITSVGTVKANAMTMKNDTTTSATQAKLSVYDVEKLICDLPYTIKVKDIDKVKAARNAYEDLNQRDKERIDCDTLDILNRSEKKMKQVEADVATANQLVEKINKLKVDVGYSKNNDVVDIANKSILKTKIQEIKDIREAYDKLDYFVKYEEKLVTNFDIFFEIECNLAQVAI